MADDLETQFNQIVSQLNMEDTAPEGHISLRDINRTIAGMNEACTYLGRFIDEVLRNKVESFPAEVAGALAQIDELTDKVSKVLSQCSCDDCSDACPNCVEDPHGLCDECAAYFEEEDDSGS